MKKLILTTILLTSGLTAHAASKYCVDDGKQDGSDYLALISKEESHKLKRSYVPTDLVGVPKDLTWNKSGSSEQLRKDVLQAFTDMTTAAKASDVTIKIYSGYRSFDSQCSTYASKFPKFKDKFKTEAELATYVQSISAVPGRSEHQLGATFDLVYPSLGPTLSYPDIKERCPENKCKEYEWLLNNAHNFGIAMSYPRYSKNLKIETNPITQYNFEPWHWRYVGAEAASEIFKISNDIGRRLSVLEYSKYKKGLLTYENLQDPEGYLSNRTPQSVTQEIVIGMGGDVSLSRPGSDKLDATGSTFSSFSTWEQMTVGLKKMTAGNDLNFLNLESVVSAKTNAELPIIEGKKYPQKSHPKGVEYLVNQVGFNMISSANNHAYDYDQAGIDETVTHLKDIQSRAGKQVYLSGVGTLEETVKPQIMEVNGLRIAFVAVGMKGDDRPHWETSWSPTTEKNGMLSVRLCKSGKVEKAMVPCPEYADLKLVLENLKNTPADLRIVSIHEGMELSVYTKNGSAPDSDAALTKDGKQRQRSENRNIEAKMNLIKSYGIDLIIGHHTHNVRPIEFNKKSFAAYSLGNLLFLGGKNYSTNDFPLWNRFGLFVKNYYSFTNGKLELAASQIIPTKNSHISPTYWDAPTANQYVDFLNAASKKSLGENAVEFKSLNNGTAVFCVPGVEKGAKALAICPAG
ncbi:MAG: CapA family protein [Bdellovibrionota bacterium]